MRHFLYIICLGCLLFSACEDAIDVTLDEAENLVTIDAWLNDIPDEIQTIRITSSQPFFDSSFVAGINQALVSVSSSTGQNFTFDKADQDGTYELQNLQNEWLQEPIGATYTLNIDIDGISYTATSGKNPVPPIDSILQEERIGEAFTEDGIYCNFFATDLPGLGDSYWIRTYKNGVFLNRPAEINIAFDSAFSAGSEVDNLVFIQPIQELNNPVDDMRAPIPWLPGEVIRVELHAITNEAFFFLEILRDQLLNSDNSIFTEPLANTNGNVIGSDGKEVLGFFNVSSASVLEATIGE